MPTPRLFGRDSSKQPGVEPGASESESKPRGQKAGTAANSSVLQAIFGDLLGREKAGDGKPGA